MSPKSDRSNSTAPSFPPRVFLSVKAIINADEEWTGQDEYLSLQEAEHMLAQAKAEVVSRCLQLASCRNYSRADVEQSIRDEFSSQLRKGTTDG